MRISEFIEQSSRLSSPFQLFLLLQGAARDSGLDWVAYGALTYHNELRATDAPAPAVLLNYPTDWLCQYFERSYQTIDPVVLYTPHMRGPYLWEWLTRDAELTDQQCVLFEEAREVGLKAGLSVPLHGPLGRVAVVSFASAVGAHDIVSQLGHLNALAHQFHLRYLELVNAERLLQPPVHLSERERDCLGWVARGKSSWDIGMILGISENTVNFHIKNAMRKLGATSRMVAILKAVRLNLIVDDAPSIPSPTNVDSGTPPPFRSTMKRITEGFRRGHPLRQLGDSASLWRGVDLAPSAPPSRLR